MTPRGDSLLGVHISTGSQTRPLAGGGLSESHRIAHRASGFGVHGRSAAARGQAEGLAGGICCVSASLLAHHRDEKCAKLAVDSMEQLVELGRLWTNLSDIKCGEVSC